MVKTKVPPPGLNRNTQVCVNVVCVCVFMRDKTKGEGPDKQRADGNTAKTNEQLYSFFFFDVWLRPLKSAKWLPLLLISQC